MSRYAGFSDFINHTNALYDCFPWAARRPAKG